MREKIYTIPVTEAFEKHTECAFCEMRKELEQSSVEFVTGASLMERDVRDTMDKRGFCGDHLKMMFKSRNALGVGLILQTRLMRIGTGNAAPQTCYICDRIDATFNLYVSTFFHLWKKESDFRKLSEHSKGFCLPHFSLITEEGEKHLSSKEYSFFKETFSNLQADNMKRLEEEIDWFVKKFDYRFANEPWKNSQDCVERIILKLTSKSVE